MNPELLYALLTGIEELLEVDPDNLFALPVPLDSIGTATLDETDPHRPRLRFSFTTVSVTIRNVLRSVRADAAAIGEDPAQNITVMQVWLEPLLQFVHLLDVNAPEYLTYDLTIPNIPEGVIEPGHDMGMSVQQLRVGFVTRRNVVPLVNRYIHPAIVVRLIAAFSQDFRQLLIRGHQSDPTGQFGLSTFLELYDRLVVLHEGTPDQVKLYKEALKHEYNALLAEGVVLSQAVRSAYLVRIYDTPASQVTRAEAVANFHVLAEAAADKAVHLQVTDLNLHFVVLREDQYNLEVVDIRGNEGFRAALAQNNTTHKVMVNGPVMDVLVCGKQARGIRALQYALATGWDGLDGMIKGTPIIRGAGPLVGDCPIPDDPSVHRYHFVQFDDHTYEMRAGRIVDAQTPDYACAIEPVIGVFREGKRIGMGHEIDTQRKEPDDPFKNKRSIQDGIPILGRCERLGQNYLFVLIRPDFFRPPPNQPTWEELIQFMRDIHVIEAFITDGDDSVGLIVDDRVVLQPGMKKSTIIPLAVAYQRRV